MRACLYRIYIYWYIIVNCYVNNSMIEQEFSPIYISIHHILTITTHHHNSPSQLFMTGDHHNSPCLTHHHNLPSQVTITTHHHNSQSQLIITTHHHEKYIPEKESKSAGGLASKWERGVVDPPPLLVDLTDYGWPGIDAFIQLPFLLHQRTSYSWHWTALWDLAITPTVRQIARKWSLTAGPETL